MVAITVPYRPGAVELIKASGRRQKFQGDTPLMAANAAAVSGDCIEVNYGTFTNDHTLGKDGVNWDFRAGTKISHTGTAERALFTDGGSNHTYDITGDCTFERISNFAGLQLANAHCFQFTGASTVSIRGRRVINTAALNFYGLINGYILNQNNVNSEITLDFDDYDLTTAVLCWWTDGLTHINGRNCSLGGDYSALLYSEANGNDCHISIDSLMGTGMPVLVQTNAGASAAIWLRGNRWTVTANNENIVAPFIKLSGDEKVYFDHQKVEGISTLDTVSLLQILNGSGQLWYRVGKTIVNCQTGFDLQTGYVRELIAPDIEVAANCTNGIVNCSGGEHDIYPGNWRGASATHGHIHSGGIARYHGGIIDLSGAASKNPASVSAAGLSLFGTRLIANGSEKSIKAPSTQTVTVDPGTTWNNTTENITVSVLSRP